jgi:hypothetical protein
VSEDFVGPGHPGFPQECEELPAEFERFWQWAEMPAPPAPPRASVPAVPRVE